MSYVVPQVQVFQEFSQIATVLTEPLRACIIGPHYHLSRFTVAGEKASGLLGAYAPTAPGGETAYAWPGKPASAVVDQAFTRLFIENAYLLYFTGAVDVLTRNTIRSSTKNFVSYTNPITSVAYARATDFKQRDVMVGDIVHVIGTGPNSAYEKWTSVSGFVHDQTASSVSAATTDVNNGNLAVANTTVSYLVNTGGFTIAQNAAYGAISAAVRQAIFADGLIRETYTLEILTGGAVGVATMRVTSSLGTDSVALVTISTLTGQAVGARGLTVNFTGATTFVVGDRYQLSTNMAYTAKTAISSFASVTDPYTGPSDTTYVITVSKGGATGVAQVVVTTTNGVDAGGPYVVVHNVALAIGQYGVKITLNNLSTNDGINKGDTFYIPAVSKKDADIKTLVLADNLPDGMVPGTTSVDSYYFEQGVIELYIKETIEVPSCDPATGTVNYDQTNADIQVKAGLNAYNALWYDTVDGILDPLPIKFGTVYAHYRALKQNYVDGVQTISALSTVIATLGPSDVDNPLSLGVTKALLNANSTEVKFVSIASNDLAGYTAAVEKLVGRTDVYSLVPLTHDRPIQAMVDAHIKAMSISQVGRWRIGWFGAPEIPIKLIKATTGQIIDNPGVVGTQFTYVTASAGAGFTTAGVRAGDILRAQYTVNVCGVETYAEYVIASVVNEQTVVLQSGPSLAPPAIDARLEVWRTLTRTEQASELKDLALSFGTRRVRLVWPDKIALSGIQMASYYAAAALAGLRSGVVPHQGLTNVEVAGFDDVRRDYFNATQQDIMAEGGVWTIAQDPTTLRIYSRHQLTTGHQITTVVGLTTLTTANEIDQREDSVTTNFDSISYFFLNDLAKFIGRANVVPTTLALINTQLQSAISFLKTNGYTDTLGAQLIDAIIDEVKAHPELADQVIAKITLVLPKPLNNIQLTLVI